MKLYFDNVLIDPDYYTQCSQTGLLFNENDTFKLGSTVCRSFTIGVDKNAISEIPTNIELEFDNVRYKQFRIDKYEENDVEYIFYLVDRMIDLDFKYDASEIFIGGKTTLKAILEDICSKIGVTSRVYDYLLKTEDNKHLTTENESILKTEGNVNAWWQDKEINWYNDKITAREYISYIAELNGGYAIINNNNEMEIRTYNNNVVYELNSLNCDSLKIGNQHKITKVIYDFGIVKYEAGTDGEIVYINQNNKFITSQSDINEIYNLIKDFEFYTITNQNAMIGNADIGECIRVDDEYLTIVQINNWKYNVNTWIGGYNLNINSSTLEESVIEETLAEQNEHIRGIDVEIDRANNQIVLKATADGHLAQVELGSDAEEGSSFNVQADNINLEGYTTINEVFSIDEEGYMDVNSNVTGIYNYDNFDLKEIYSFRNNRLTLSSNSPIFKVLDYDNTGEITYADYVTIYNIIYNQAQNTKNATVKFVIDSKNPKECIKITDENDNTSCSLGVSGVSTNLLNAENIVVTTDNTGELGITLDGTTGNIYTFGTISQGSKEELKKNFVKYENALDLIKNIDIYSYHLKSQNDNEKKHIGFVIGDNYKYSEDLTTKNNDGVDLYSFVSVCCQAIKEQQSKIEELEQRIQNLERKDK